VPVVRYTGKPDDAEGTRIQNGGPTASPRGPGGGVGPGEVGNFIVTGHRTSHSAPFADLPSLRVGDRVRIRSGREVSVYRIVATRWTSFRSPKSLAEQAAPVPGRPGATPVRRMITLSTCATPEDHAAGNYWSDRFGNPEHRIDKIGVLVAQSRVDPGTT
jgi:sortase A